MKHKIILDLKDYIVETFSEGYYIDSNGDKLPFKINVSNHAETDDGEAYEEVSVTFPDKTPNGNTEFIEESIKDSLSESSNQVVIEKKDYQTLTHSAGYVVDDNDEFYPFSIEVLSAEGETDVVEIIWDDIQPEGDIDEIENQILEELNED